MKAKMIRYEQKTCSRCGGSGRYSYNPMDGDRCYGCHGTAKQLTAAGKKARAAVEAWKVEHGTVLAKDLQPGDVVMSGTTKIRVASVEAYPYPARSTTHVDGKNVCVEHVMVEIHDVRGPGKGLITAAEAKMIRVPRGESYQAMAAYAATLKGVTVEYVEEEVV